MRAVLGGLAAALIAAATTLAAPLSASAAPISSCTTSTGTIIAVDYSHWGGPIVRGCDLTTPSSGITLLNDAGFRTTGTQHDGPQFLCRIGNQAYQGGTQYPTPKDESCVQTPPASAYWSYWLAPKGQNTWSYSQFGAYSEKPLAGEVELWIFGGTDITGSNGAPVNGFPVCTPNSLRAGGSASTCTPTGGNAGTGKDNYRPRVRATAKAAAKSKAKAASRGDGGSGSSGSGGGSAATRAPAAGGGATHRSGTSTNGAPSAASRSESDAANGGATAGTSTRTAGGSAVNAAPAGNIVAAEKASTKAPPAGSAVPLVIGIGLAVVLGAGGGFAVWRRRPSE